MKYFKISLFFQIKDASFWGNFDHKVFIQGLRALFYIENSFECIQADLVKTLTRAGNTLLDHGAVIEKVESMGHKDLPYKRITKQTNEPVYSSKYAIKHH